MLFEQFWRYACFSDFSAVNSLFIFLSVHLSVCIFVCMLVNRLDFENHFTLKITIWSPVKEARVFIGFANSNVLFSYVCNYKILPKINSDSKLQFLWDIGVCILWGSASKLNEPVKKLHMMQTLMVTLYLTYWFVSILYIYFYSILQRWLIPN